MSVEKRRRITVKYKSANPLFEQWLFEWKKEAERKHSKVYSTFSKALISLRKCPIRFNSAQECKILKGFGDKLCKMLDNKLKEYNSRATDSDCSNTIVLDEKKHENVTNKLTQQIPSSSRNLCEGSQENENVASKVVPICSKKKGYSKQKLTKQTSITSEDVSDNPEENKNVATKVVCTQTLTKGNPKQTSSTSENISEESQDDFYILEPGNFDIILYVDTAETVGHTLERKSDPLLMEFNKLPGLCQYEIKRLNVGDYLWICRDKTTKKELVLPYIFERKRLDDLAGSIKDGRYKEQKFRLKKSGIENIYYLIEHYRYHSLPLATLQQAAFNTAIQDGFKVKMTSNLGHTARLLSKFSSLITRTFEGKTLLRCPKENLTPVDLSDDLISLMSFTEFNQSSVKNKPMKVTDLFTKMLIQIHGMSVDRALAVTERFPTPMSLKKSYNECDETPGEKLLENIKVGNRKLGASLSKTVYQLFNLKKY